MLLTGPSITSLDVRQMVSGWQTDSLMVKDTEPADAHLLVKQGVLCIKGHVAGYANLSMHRSMYKACTYVVL